MTIDLAAFRQSFIEEARENVAALERGLLDLEREPRCVDTVNAVFRAAHSIKGAAGTLGFSAIAVHTHLMETALEAMRSGELDATPAAVTVLLSATDTLRGLIEVARSGDAPTEELTEIHRQLEQLGGYGRGTTSNGDVQPSPGRERRRVRLTIVPNHDFFRLGLDPILLFRDLEQLGTLEGIVCDLSKVPALSQFEPTRCYVAWTAVVHTAADDNAIRDVFVFVADDCQISIETDAGAPVERRHGRKRPQMRDPTAAIVESSTLRVPSEKVDSIIDLVGELVIAQSIVMQLIDATSLAKSPILRDAIGTMTRNMLELQERVMGVRMVPVATLFERFTRIVRDMAASLGKDANLTLEGQDTEIDKAVIERLADPMTHLVRNALDHGLETDAERQLAGKLEPAAICLAARHVAGGVVIQIADNGRGLDTRRIREKADAIGLTRPEDNLTDDQIHGLIFEAGFSTAQQVTDLSGRGVGMDVVRRCVDSLNGTITVATEPGQGTTFEIRLPLTLTILDGLMLRVEHQTYVLPLLAVTESFRPRVETVKHVAGEGMVAILRDCALPLVDLGTEFGLRHQCRNPAQALVVVVEADGKRVGVVVDSLVGQSQVVVKGIERHYRRVDGVMGATILGDGTVAFIVDVAGLVRVAWSRRATRETRGAA